MDGQKGRVYGYARVSAADQNLDRQLIALEGVDTLLTEKMSGKNRTDRVKLAALMEIVAPGDVIRVMSVDRLARSTTDLLAILDELQGKGVTVEFIDNPALNTSTPVGKFMVTVLAAIAELERATIRERQAEGIAAAKKKGVYSRNPKLTEEQIAEARERIAAEVPKTVVARDLGVTRQTLYNALNGTGVYADGGAA